MQLQDQSWAQRSALAEHARQAQRQRTQQRRILRTGLVLGLMIPATALFVLFPRPHHAAVVSVLPSPTPALPTFGSTAVTGRFYRSADQCVFAASPSTQPILTEQFTSLAFRGRPFTDFGSSRRIAAAGAVVIGSGQFNHFNAVFTGSFLVAHPRSVTLTLQVDDAFTLGIGSGATRLHGTLLAPPRSGHTALLQLPVVGALNLQSALSSATVTLSFPHPGTYPYELDYAECHGGGATLQVSTAGHFLTATQTKGA